MRLYDANGWLDMPKLLTRPFTFNIIIGARGTGKTYGGLKWALDNNINHIYMRRTAGELEAVIKQQKLNPYFEINPALTWGKGGATGLVPVYDADNNIKGFGTSLAAVGRVRGFSGSSIDFIFYDEFVRKATEPRKKGEGTAVFDIYESINRNRELIGLPPVKFLAASNSDSLVNDLFVELNLVTCAQKMKEKGIEVYEDPARGIALYMPNHSPISEKKKDTALYRLLGNNAYSRMALGNEFINEDLTNVESKRLAGFTPLVIVGELCIYKHKSKREYYVTTHKSGTPETYTAAEMDLKRFRRDYAFVWLAYLGRRVYFETYINKCLFERYFDI